MTVGIAVATTDASSETRNVATNSATVISRRSGTADQPYTWSYLEVESPRRAGEEDDLEVERMRSFSNVSQAIPLCTCGYPSPEPPPWLRRRTYPHRMCHPCPRFKVSPMSPLVQTPPAGEHTAGLMNRVKAPQGSTANMPESRGGERQRHDG